MRYALEAKVSDIMYERFLSLEFWRYDDKDTGLRLAKAGAFFWHAKAVAIRTIQIRALMQILNRPDDSEGRGMALLDAARARIAAGDYRPVVPAPEYRRA